MVYYMPGTILSIGHILIHFILITNIRGSYLSDEEIEINAQRIK